MTTEPLQNRNIAFIGLGGNIGNTELCFQQALECVARSKAEKLLACSSLYRTAPWGGIKQASFLNAAVKIQTRRSPEQLLDFLLGIELVIGRKRFLADYQENGPRLIDLDLLFYGELIIKSPKLIVPHPHIAERQFVLQPMCELAPRLLHPRMKRTMCQLSQDLGEQAEGGVLEIYPFEAAVHFLKSLD